MKNYFPPMPPFPILFGQESCINYENNVATLNTFNPALGVPIFYPFGNTDGTEDYLASIGEEWSPNATRTTVEGPSSICSAPLGTVIANASGSPGNSGFRFTNAPTANILFPATWWLSLWFFSYNVNATILASEGQRVITMTHNGTSSKWRVGWNDDGILRYVGSTGSQVIGTLESNRWYNLIMCKKTEGSGSADYDIYLDGELKVSQSLSVASTSNHDWWIGNQAGAGGASARPLRGGIYGLTFGLNSILDQDDVNYLLG